MNKLQFWNWRGDLFEGLSAAIVALPLALAFGVSSGAGAIAGLYGAIFVVFLRLFLGELRPKSPAPLAP